MTETAPPSDEALLARVARRDVEALTDLYDRHRAAAFAIALRVTASVPAAEDAIQDAFLDAWRQASAFDATRGSARSWLLAVVHHRAIDLVRRRRSSDPLPEATDLPASLVAPDVWPEVAGRLDAVAVRAALTSLPGPQREAIELAYWGGLTQSEIAARTGVPLGTVKGRMRLGLGALALALRGTIDRSGPAGPVEVAEPHGADRSRTSGAPDARGAGTIRELRALLAALGSLLSTTRRAGVRPLRPRVAAVVA